MDLKNVHRLSVFIAVAESQSFSRAAESLQVSQPAVSRQVKELEDMIGSPLLDRTGRRLALTEAGLALLGHARKVKETIEEMEAEMEAVAGGVAGLLKLGASTVWEYVLPGLMGDFKRQHPSVTLGLTIGNTNQIVEMMVQKQVHLGFVGDKPNVKVLETIPLLDDEIVIIAPPSHKLAGRKRVPPIQLNRLPFVQRESDSATAQLSEAYLARLGVKAETVMDLGSHEAIKRAVQAGFGLGMISKFAVEQEIAAGTLVQVHLDAPPCKRPLFVLRNRSRYYSPAQQAFIEHVMKVVGPRRKKA
ncbi:MAG: LysR family transcriptional regulator [Chloroflexi bacterium]|nr:LysR family transcriptional regulator [Chloroflexota bacterium]